MAKGLRLITQKVYHTKLSTPVEEIQILKADPKYFSLNFHVNAGANRDIDEWSDYLETPAVINGSYYGKLGQPIIPIKIKGETLGPDPKSYNAQHGAVTINSGEIDILDFENQAIELNSVSNNYQNYMVSYPLLIDRKAQVRRTSKDHWLANRTFIAKNKQGEILLGVTKNAFFSLTGLGDYLVNSNLEIEIALNLDGGPVTGMAIDVGDFRKTIYGKWELAGEVDEPTILIPGNKGKKWPLPIVIALTSKFIK